MVLAKEKYNIVGTRPVRHDGADKVTGRALYGADVKLSGLLEGAVLRSPHAHARIVSIDTSEAEAMEGVYAVVTAADMPESGDKVVDIGEGDTRLSYVRGNVLAHDKVRYCGHAIAAVAAVSTHVAQQACEKIKVVYEPLPAVTTTQAAMADGAPVIHDDLHLVEFGEKTGKVGNVAEHFRYDKGDIEAGFAEADVVVEREFDTATVHQGYLEPQNATALWNNDERLEIWTSTQGAFPTRDVTATVLDLPVSQVKVKPMEIGGGFGGKIPVYLEPVAALLSKKSGRPVKLVMSRKDVFEATGPTPGSHIKVKMGATKDGRIVAAKAWMAYEAGAYPGAFTVPGAMCIFACYDVDNISIDGFDVVVNKPSTAAYRAPGATNAAFAAESVVDELAEKLGMDPIDLRLKNAAKEGTRRADGVKYPRIGCVEVLEAMKAHPHYSAPLGGPNRGRGVAVGFWFNVGLESSCTIALNADGKVSLVEGSTDIGGTRTSIAMQAAEVLGIPVEDIHPSVVDTDSVGYTAVTGGSRTTFATGWAAYEAAHDLIKGMKVRAAKMWKTEADNVEFSDGVFTSDGESITFKELAALASRLGGPVVGRATVKPKGVGGSFAGNIVDVEVDPETGKTKVLRFTAFQDAGKAVHPSYVEGQMQGGSAQGIGWGLNEEYFMDSEGRMRNTSLLDYRMPTALDLPMIDTCIIEVANPGHPYGVRGVGEANIVPPPGALANAIHGAAGVRMPRLPMNPVHVMEAIWEQQA
ncbi:MAG: xanthine dehydrogenase family protein molybdopterin-binding subunit [Bryobacterales bacterium]|nr:xanthine dehydrogenase family protein molybdopterin-binding subunit [Acidobacteriota bacterium]MCB9384577.1 xanthine dehydrogenase family protein molybdopterin-binding subunit [Bryobacterales bacterium]